MAIEHDLVVITDEVYEHLTFDGAEHVPIATLPGMFERTLTLSSAGKSYSFTGWKVGWATGPAELVGAVLAAKQWLTFTSGSPLQPAVALALDEAAGLPARAGPRPPGAARPAGRRARARPGSTAYVPAGHLLRHRVGRATSAGPDGLAFCRALPERAGVVAIPTQVFYDDQADPDGGRDLVRFAFCKTREVIEDGAARLAAGRPQRLSQRRATGRRPRRSSDQRRRARGQRHQRPDERADDAEQAQHGGQPGRDRQRGGPSGTRRQTSTRERRRRRPTTAMTSRARDVDARRQHRRR